MTGISSTTIQSTPVRLATFMLFLSTVFLFTSYAASIVALLQSTSKTIEDAKDLADKPISFSVQDTKHNYIYLNVNNTIILLLILLLGFNALKKHENYLVTTGNTITKIPKIVKESSSIKTLINTSWK